MNRKIIHIDQDCFYAAVEIRDNPRLKGKPVAVGGRPEGRGVLTTANYEARKYGVKSAMPTSQALKLCPQLILAPINFSKYRAESKKIREIFKLFTDKIEPLSLDEAYLDVTNCKQLEGSATLIAKEIRRLIYEKTKLTASAGIAENKFLAKVASDWNKPNGQKTITPSQTLSFATKLPVNKIPGVGKVTTKKMHSLNIKTCADLQKLTIEQLSYHFGSWGLRLYDVCRGIDYREVQSRGKSKSLSVENTYSKDLTSLDVCLSKLPMIYSDFKERLDNYKNNYKISSLFVKIKFYDFTQTTIERSKYKEPSLELFKEIFEEAYYRQAEPVRLIGIGVKFDSPKKRIKTAQLDLF